MREEPLLSTCSIQEQINLLGPWVHGRFDLGNGITIESSNPAQHSRLLWMIDTLTQYLIATGYENRASELTILDIGCNAGFVTSELQRRFKFKRAVGVDPRERNIRKARFVQQYLKVPGLEF